MRMIAVHDYHHRYCDFISWRYHYNTLSIKLSGTMVQWEINITTAQILSACKSGLLHSLPLSSPIDLCEEALTCKTIYQKLMPVVSSGFNFKITYSSLWMS